MLLRQRWRRRTGYEGDHRWGSYRGAARRCGVGPQGGYDDLDWHVPPTEFHNWMHDVFLNLVGLPGLSGLVGRYFASSFKSIIKD